MGFNSGFKGLIIS